MEAQSDSIKNIISLRNIHQEYEGGKVQVIKDLNLEIPYNKSDGKIIGLMGMSGCGKSTLLRYIAGLQVPTKGEVLIRNKPVNRNNRASMVFQQYSSLPWMTVLENVALALKFKGMKRKDREEKALEILEKVGLAGHEEKYALYPNLSGGQLQRVAIARSLLANSDILLMDEPFGALDINTRLQMQDLLLKIASEYHPTIIFVTHDISEAVYLAEEVYIMKAPPSRIVEKVTIDLDKNRNNETKRSKQFTELVHHVEDRMIEIARMN